MIRHERRMLYAGLVVTLVFTGNFTRAEETEEEHHHTEAVTQAMAALHESIDGHAHHEVHMKWTAPKLQTAAEQQHAAEIVNTLRSVLAKYTDVRVAEQEGYKPFLPQFSQPMYHFTNYWRGFKAAFRFDPAQPTSLLYKRTTDGYELIGAMYTAPKRMSEERLNQHVPLSIARWHAHVNLCFPPRGTDPKTVNWSRFGVCGAIAIEEECGQAGGRFWPQIFGWMVHVYPFEDTPDKIWAHR